MKKDKKTEYLLSSIGEIDDVLLTEAVTYRKKRKKHFLIPLIAACLAFTVMAMTALSLSIMIPVGIMLFGDLAEKNDAEVYPDPDGAGDINGVLDQRPSQSEDQDGTDETEGDAPDNGIDETQGDASDNGTYETEGDASDNGTDDELDGSYGNTPGSADPLASLLGSFGESGECISVESFEELSYVGEPSLVWQNGDEGEIFVKPLTVAQLESVKRNMGRGEQVGQYSPVQSVKVWVIDGKGSVSTPYLKSGAGNTGSVVFDYEAEIIPSESFVDCISDILN